MTNITAKPSVTINVHGSRHLVSVAVGYVGKPVRVKYSCRNPGEDLVKFYSEYLAKVGQLGNTCPYQFIVLRDAGEQMSVANLKQDPADTGSDAGLLGPGSYPKQEVC